MNIKGTDEKILSNDAMNMETMNYDPSDEETQEAPNLSGVEGIQTGQWRQEAASNNPGVMTEEQQRHEEVNQENIRKLEERKRVESQKQPVNRLAQIAQQRREASAGKP